jgi:hypothetical protein
MQGICTLFYFRGISVNLTISSTLCPEPDVAAVKICKREGRLQIVLRLVRRYTLSVA